MAYTKFMITCMLHFRESYPESCPRIIPRIIPIFCTREGETYPETYPRNIPPNIPRIIPPDATRFAGHGVFGKGHITQLYATYFFILEVFLSVSSLKVPGSHSRRRKFCESNNHLTLHLRVWCQLPENYTRGHQRWSIKSGLIISHLSGI